MRPFLDADEATWVGRFKSSPKLQSYILALVLSVAFLLYLAMLKPERFGDYYDDSVYVTTAKALATGQGYKIVSLPYEPAQTLYPPFYPFLLSLIWRVYSPFPENLFWMMLLSVAATLSFLALTYRYLVKQGYATPWQALIVVALVAINWRTMLLATNLISELVFAALSVLGLHLTEEYEKERKSWRSGVAPGVVLGLAFLTRSSGLALLLAVAAHALLRKHWRRMLLPLSIGGTCVFLWMAWCYLNRTSYQGINAVYYAGYIQFFRESLSRLQELNHTSLLTTSLNVVGTNVLLFVVASMPLASLGLRFDLPQGLLLALIFAFLVIVVVGFLRQARGNLRLVHIYVMFYLLLHLIAPGSAYDRYIFPIVPFLLLFLVTEVSLMISSIRAEVIAGKSPWRKAGAACMGLAVLAAVGLTLYSNLSGVYDSLKSVKTSAGRSTENRAAFEWLNQHAQPSDVILCYRDPLYYLFTGRKAMISSPLIVFNTVPYQTRERSAFEHSRDFLEIINESKARYFVLTSGDFKFESELYRTSVENLVKGHPETFLPMFESSQGGCAIFRINNGSQIVIGDNGF
jgi:4-amino-4-deoxy-L-arabinose transferase-like glycosyltransferase